MTGEPDDLRLLNPIVLDPTRLAVLDGLSVLDTPAEARFDDIVRLATRLCAVPVALVSLVSHDRQWFKARLGFPHCETDLDRSVCKFALDEPDLLVVPDLEADPRTASNPLVTGEPHIRFYAGAPLRLRDGQVVGSLCVIDTKPRPGGLNAEQADDLRALGRQVSDLLEMRRAVEHRDRALDRQHVELRQTRRIDVLAKASQALLIATDPAAVLDPILSANADVLGFDRSYTYDLWPDGRHLRLTHSLNATQEVQDYLHRMPYGAPLCGIVAERRQPLVLADMQGGVDPRFEQARGLGLNAYAGFPITSRGALRGVISFASTYAPAFDAEAISFFETLARLMSAVYERLDSEQALRESDARSKRAQEAGQVGTFEVDVASGMASISPEFARLYGVPPTGLYSAEQFEALVLPEERALPSNEATRQDGSAVLEAEYRIRRADDGALRWIARRARFVHDESGTVVRMFGTVQDVTERYSAQKALRESEEHWRGLFERLSEGFIVGEVIRDGSGRVTDWRYIDVNSAWGELVGVDAASVRGRTIREVFPGIEDAWVNEFAEVVATGHPVTFTRQVGTLRRWYEGRAFPLGAERFGVIFLEVTDRVEAEARRNGLLEFGNRLREDLDAAAVTIAGCEIIGRVLGVGRVGYGTVGPDGERFEVDEDWTAPGFPTLAGRYSMSDYGLYAEDLRQGSTVVIPDIFTDPRTVETAPALQAVAVRTLINLPMVEKGRTVAVLYVNDDKVRIWSEPEVGFVRQVAELVRQAVERRRAEDGQALVNEELSHRLKNSFAMVLSIAGQTLRTVPDRAPVEAFERRIHALSKAHDVLLRQSWSAASAMEVVRTVLAGGGHGDRFEISGPDFDLGPRATLSLSLLLHELATNAAKYGALSVPGGRVAIAWCLEGEDPDREVVLTWKEHGGPAPTPPASTGRKGFGSRLIGMGLTGTGGVDLRYPASGFQATMRAPLVQLQQS